MLADDHPSFPELVVNLLRSEFEVVGIVFDGQSLVETSSRTNPDIIITDISMPLQSGIEAADQLRKLGSAAKVIFLTGHSDPDFVRAGLAAGGSGYVLKSRIATDLLAAIQEVLQDRIFISPNLSPLN